MIKATVPELRHICNQVLNLLQKEYQETKS